MIQTLPNLKSC